MTSVPITWFRLATVLRLCIHSDHLPQHQIMNAKSQRLKTPRLYKEAAKIIRESEKSGSSLKSLIFSAKHPVRNVILFELLGLGLEVGPAWTMFWPYLNLQSQVEIV